MRILILLLILAGACSRGEKPEPVEKAPEPSVEEAAKPAEEATPEPPPEPPPGIEAVIDLDAPPTVELVDAGKAPHEVLRASFEAGAKQSLRIESQWSLETVYGPMVHTTAVMPSLAYELETEVKEANDQGARFGFRVSKVTAKSREGVKPGQLEAAKKLAASLEGKAGSFTINARGILGDFKIDAPSDASLLASDMTDQIKQAIRLWSLPLPKEPIGKGAKWTTTQIVEQRTAKFKRTSYFELAEVKGKEVRATGQHAAEAPKQKLVLPGSRSGATFKLDKVELPTGESKGTWDLNQTVPASASEHVVTVFMMTATAPKKEAVIMAVDTALKVEAKD